MRHKLICRFTAILLTLVFLPTHLLAVPALAADTSTDGWVVSDDGLDWIKSFEGFSDTVYSDSGSWYIGYGTRCEPEDYPDGITEPEAEELLRAELSDSELTLNDWLSEIGCSVTQSQFDALADFTYNLGVGWMNTDCKLVDVLSTNCVGVSEVSIVNAFGVWCHANKQINPGLVQRRLAEACLFLYGDYQGDFINNFVYLALNANGGSVENDIVFYEKGCAYDVLPDATREDSVLSGWESSDGFLLTANEIADASINVTARWSEETPWVNPFSDVKETDWYYTYLGDLNRSGVVAGYTDGTFRPTNSLTLGESLALVLRATGYEAQESDGDGHWAAGYLDVAVSNGFLDDENCDLDVPASRLTIARIAAKALELGESQIETPFADSSDGYVLALYEVGIFQGSYSGDTLVFKPDASITRAEISAVLWRILNTDVHAGQLKYNSTWLDILEDVPVNSYDADRFYLSDGRMCYDSADRAYYTGIDVSVYQGDIDWEAVREDGIDFAFIRLGFRGYGSEGSMNLDSRFLENIQKATEAGLDVGVYFFSQAITVEEAREEAQFVLDYLDGYELAYPVVFDWEVIGKSTARTYGLDTQTLCDCANTFCDMIEDAGYQTMIYINSYAGYVKYDLSQVLSYDLWFAQYTDAPTFYYDFQIWQYSSSGSVAGISGAVDMNISFVNYADR